MEEKSLDGIVEKTAVDTTKPISRYQTIADYVKKVPRFLKRHVVDTTAMLTGSSPIYCAWEMLGLGALSNLGIEVEKMTYDVSLTTRLNVVKLSFLGLGYAFAGLRRVSRAVCGITQETKEKAQKLHDRVFTAVFNVSFSYGVLYPLSGEEDPKKLLWASLGTGVLGFLSGAITGKAIDWFEDFTGIQQSQRVPERIRRLPTPVKTMMGAGLTATSASLIALIYQLTPN